MCTHFTAEDLLRLAAEWESTGAAPIQLGLDLDDTDSELDTELFPARMGPYIRMDRHPDTPPKSVLVAGQFGLVPHWAKLAELKKRARSLYNARTETVHEKNSFMTAWKYRNWCIVPAKAVYEYCYETGEPVQWRISRKDGKPIWIAGICWSYKLSDTGEYLDTFSLLTINADDHAVFKRMHPPQDEKRMVVMLQDDQLEPWLNASHDEARTFFCEYPADLLQAEPAPLPPRKKKS